MLEIMWDIVKAIFITLLMIIGIKLILLFIMPMSIFSLFPYSPFDNYDWNPIATIIGSFITGLIAWYAIFKTAELDRKARKYENNYKLYQEMMIDLKKDLKFLKELSSIFQNEDFDRYIKIETFQDVYNTRKIKKKLEALESISNKWEKEKSFKECIDKLLNIQIFFYEQVKEHRYYLEAKKSEYRKDYIKFLNSTELKISRQQFLETYNSTIEKDCEQYNPDFIENTIDNIEKLINKEFKLEDN